MLCAWSSCVPCEKLRRATSIPQRSRSRIWDSEQQAGPIVQMIFARRLTKFEWVGFSSGLLEPVFKWSPRQEWDRLLNRRDVVCYVSASGISGMAKETLRATPLRFGTVDRGQFFPQHSARK